jgi:hypothetical protein
MLAGQPTALARHVLESATGTVHNTYRGFCTVGGEVEVHPMPLLRQLQNRARARALGMDLADHSSSRLLLLLHPNAAHVRPLWASSRRARRL